MLILILMEDHRSVLLGGIVQYLRRQCAFMCSRLRVLEQQARVAFAGDAHTLWRHHGGRHDGLSARVVEWRWVPAKCQPATQCNTRAALRPLGPLNGA